MPVHHVIDAKGIDLTFFFEEFEYFPAKGVFQYFQAGRRPFDEHAVPVKNSRRWR
jgi:hypothetical protein